MNTGEITSKGILDMARGAFRERADYEMARLVENILDPNTAATKVRKMTLTLTLKPDENRENVVVSLEAKSALAPTHPVMTALYVADRDSDGTPQVLEMVPQIPGQQDLTGGEQEAPALLRLIGR
jgi:hypothetical protein